jgi:hypothetical protein
MMTAYPVKQALMYKNGIKTGIGLRRVLTTQNTGRAPLITQKGIEKINVKTATDTGD